MTALPRFFPKLPNQICEPDTTEHVQTPLPESYSFSSLGSLVSPEPSPPSVMLFSHPPTPRVYGINESPVFQNGLHITIPKIETAIETKPHSTVPESSPHFATNTCCFQTSS